jgi:group I intron endonuclease
MKLTDKFEKLSGIYIIKNLINGKVYVGESFNIHKRIKEHKTQKKLIIHSALKKYGIDNFEVYVEYLPDFSKNDRLDLEEQLIIKFDSIAPNGYNICSRGEGSTGLKMSPESRLKMSINSHNKGKYGRDNFLSKPVFVYTIDGNFITSYIGYAEAARDIGTTHGVISMIISGKTQQVNGHIFKNEYLGKTIPPLSNSSKRLRRRKVACYDIDGNLINNYSSVSEASRLTNLHRCEITELCKGIPNNKSVNIIWKYIN